MYWCLGFIFSPSLREVLLLKKGKSLHIGKWNGLGGALEAGENARTAMVRECREESGLSFDRDDWTFVGLLTGGSWDVGVFAAQCGPTPWNPPYPTAHEHRTFEMQESDKPLFTPLFFLPILNLAPHTGALIYSSLDKLRNPALPAIKLEEQR
jgi:8-oxo-dGTP pyrophosphatase MutT (NUDIX family)